MKVLQALGTALYKNNVFVPFKAIEDCAGAIREQAENLHQRDTNRPLDDIIIQSTKGFITEIGISKLLEEDKEFWARFSPQSNFKERLYDIGFTWRQDFKSFRDVVHSLEVKTAKDNGRYLEFNKGKGRRGLSLQNFLDNAKSTEFLVTASYKKYHTDSLKEFLGWIVTPEYVFHRSAFNDSTIYESEISTKPDSYVWYDTAISSGLCIKLQ